MKKIIIAIAFIFVSFATYAQVDTTFKIDMSQNVSRCECETFGQKLKAYRLKNELSEATMAAWLSGIASGVHRWSVNYTIKEYRQIENDTFVPFLKVQEAILENIAKNQQSK